MFKYFMIQFFFRYPQSKQEKIFIAMYKASVPGSRLECKYFEHFDNQLEAFVNDVNLNIVLNS